MTKCVVCGHGEHLDGLCLDEKDGICTCHGALALVSTAATEAVEEVKQVVWPDVYRIMWGMDRY